ncbi:MAG: hypothetical protein DMF61_06145 [Blastocatellia bacterium AA13]|nr:MAG: hypothetical protein DMF61_06145 [Blastocatellia bacterium AA13]
MSLNDGLAPASNSLLYTRPPGAETVRITRECSTFGCHLTSEEAALTAASESEFADCAMQ